MPGDKEGCKRCKICVILKKRIPYIQRIYKLWRTLKPGLAWPQNGPGLTFGLKFGLVPNFSPAPKLTTSERVGLKLNFPHICKEIIEFFNV